MIKFARKNTIMLKCKCFFALANIFWLCKSSGYIILYETERQKRDK